MRHSLPTRLAAALIPFLLLTGCMTTRGLTPPPEARSKSWAVVSTMGHAASFQHIGFTVFNNVYNKVDTTAWNLDAKIEEAVEKERPAMKWKRLALDDKERQQISAIKPEPMTGIFDIGDRKEAISLLARRCDCDYALVISPVRTGDHITLTNQNLNGYGVHQRANIHGDHAYIFSNYAVVLLDPKTGTEYGYHYGQPWEKASFKLVKAREVVPTAEELAIVEHSVTQFLLAGVINSMAGIPNN